jgi:uncharacterized membrane protein
MTIGPVQMLVVGFEGPKFKGEILEELKRLKDEDIIRLIDLLVIKKNDDGTVETLHQSDLSGDEAMEFGAVAGALVGLGAAGEEGAKAGARAGAEAMEDGHAFDEEKVWYAADAIPNGTAAGIALIEHRWAIPLRDAIVRAGGIPLIDEWIHATDLVAAGLKMEEAAAQTR